MSSSNDAILKTHTGLIIAGFVCILVASLFDYKLQKVDVDELLANIGALILFVGGAQWLFDATTRKKLYEEITKLTVRNVHVATSGIDDVVENSRDVNYTDAIKNSSRLIVGLNYSPRLLEDYHEAFLSRCGERKESTFLVVDPESKAGALLLGNQEEEQHIRPNLAKIRRICSELKENGSGGVDVLVHSEVLHYSFVLLDDCVWIKPYRTSRGRSSVPAVRIKNRTFLFSYFQSDIDQLVSGAKGK